MCSVRCNMIRGTHDVVMVVLVVVDVVVSDVVVVLDVSRQKELLFLNSKTLDAKLKEQIYS